MASGTVEQSVSQTVSQAGSAQQGNSRSQLVQRLLEANNLPAFINDLLTTQAVTVAGTEAAGFVIERSEEGTAFRPIAHIRPDSSGADTRAAAIKAFSDLVRPCVEQDKDGAIEVGSPNDAAETQFCLVTLLRNEGEVVAVSAVVTRCINVERAKQRLMSMQLVAGYFELFTLRRTSEQARMIAQSHQHVLQLATSVATAEGFDSAAMNLCNELASRSGATRVSIGWVKGNSIRVKALSHTEEFDKKQELIVSIQRVMEECLDQEEIVQFDASGQSSDNVSRDAQALSRSQGGHIVLSLPLRRRAEVVGVTTLEFLPQQPLGPNVASGLAVAVDLIAPQLYDRYQNDRWLITKVGLSIREGAKMLVGPRQMLGKVIAAAIIAVAIFVWFFKPMYHVSAAFEFAPVSRFSLSAPYDGYVGSIAMVADGSRKLKPGDHVKQGQVLAKLETYEAEQKLAESQKRMAIKGKEGDNYLGQGKTAEAQMAFDERDEAQAEANLYQDQINKAEIRSPIAGQILKGDLEDKKGAPVKQGDVMFEVGQPDDLRAELAVAERDIQDVHVGQKGWLATNSLPDTKKPFTIERIIPVGEAKEGGNNFKVYAKLGGGADRSASWLAGMQGEARVDVRPERLAWIWTHRLIDFLKLRLWM